MKCGILLALLVLLVAGSSLLRAQQQPWDMRIQDTIIIGQASWPAAPWPDSLGIPIYVWADDTIGGFSLAFKPSDSRLKVSSFSHNGTVFDTPGSLWTGVVRDTIRNAIGFGWVDTDAQWKVNPQGLVGTIYVRIDPTIPPGTEANIDSTFLSPALYFEVTTVVDGYPHPVRPAPFSNRGGRNVILGSPYVCGDADGNAMVNISDAVFLIAYIFSGGPAPAPLLAGDADCNEMVNISDAVYLIAYIFSGGPAPCAACK